MQQFHINPPTLPSHQHSGPKEGPPLSRTSAGHGFSCLLCSPTSSAWGVTLMLGTPVSVAVSSTPSLHPLSQPVPLHPGVTPGGLRTDVCWRLLVGGVTGVSFACSLAEATEPGTPVISCHPLRAPAAWAPSGLGLWAVALRLGRGACTALRLCFASPCLTFYEMVIKTCSL